MVEGSTLLDEEPASPIVVVDEQEGTITLQSRSDGSKRVLPMRDPEAFSALSRVWLRCGWDVQQVYSFTWAGRPVIQLPEDLIRIQEVIWHLQPDLIIETGVAHGGSLVFFAGVLRLLGKGRVIGVEVELRPHNRDALAQHPFQSNFSLIEGSSTDAKTLKAVAEKIHPGESVMVVLDSSHSFHHVLAELRAYSRFVTPGSYLVVCDGIMASLVGAPRSQPDWHDNNPLTAISRFLAENVDYVAEEPDFAFNEGLVTERVTYWPRAYLRRIESHHDGGDE